MSDAGNDNWMALTDDEKRDALVQLETSPVFQAYEAEGITLRRVAKEVKRALMAKGVQHLKIKGHLPIGLKLPPGYKVITPTERVVMQDEETGIELVADPGETIIEYTAPNTALRLRAAESVLKTLGLNAAEKSEHTSRETVVHVHTHIAEPLPLPAGLRKQEGHED